MQRVAHYCDPIPPLTHHQPAGRQTAPQRSSFGRFAMSSKYMYREYDALALRSKADRQQALVKHIRKADKRKKGDEVVFDPRAHKDFVTGFRRRKQQRRKDAIK